jgi:biotin transporter BioY
VVDISTSRYVVNNGPNLVNNVCKQALKTVAFIAGKSENQVAKNFFIRFSINNLIANIIFYALSWPKLNFGCHLTFEIIFKALKPENSAFLM